MLNSLRLRLTAWYLMFFTVLLTAFAGFFYALLARHLEHRLHVQLLSQANMAASVLGAELREWNGSARPAAFEAMSEMGPKDVDIALFDGSELLAASTGSAPEVRTVEVYANAVPHEPVFLTIAVGKRAVLVPVPYNGHKYVVLAAASLASTTAQLHELATLLFAALPLGIIAAGAGGLMLAGRGLKPLVTMAGQTQQISDKNLHDRLQVAGAPSELATLAGSFNALLERLDQSFETMRRFAADASHELRTPLAVIRGEADVALSKPRSPAEYRETLEVVRDEARRLSRLVEDLLHLARADAGRSLPDINELCLDELLADCCRSVRERATGKRIELVCRAPVHVIFRGDQSLLRRLVMNLLDNAIRYTPDGGAVSVVLEDEGAGVRIVVSDTGVGIPPECTEHVFDRFYRANQARSREDGEFGLGLSIARWIAEAHRGTLELSQTSELGSTFTVSLSR